MLIILLSFQVKAYGSQLWEAVIRHINLLEADYFDLEYEDLHGLQVRHRRAW